MKSTKWMVSRVEGNWIQQDLDDDPRRTPVVGTLPRENDDFWQFNAFAGYRFWDNKGEISVGVVNLGDANYRLSPLTAYGEIPRRRTEILSYRFNF